MRAKVAVCIFVLVVSGCAEPPRSADKSNAQSPFDTTSRSEGDQTASGRRVAVSHSYDLRLPSTEIERAQRKDLAECAKLGCTVLSTSISNLGEDTVNASFSVRMTPQAYTTFASVIAAPPVVVRLHSERAEDQTIPLLDAEKRLEIKTALRDRLMAMQRDQAAMSMTDAVNISKELAQIQGDIEAESAQRAYLLSITSTVRVDVTYGGEDARVAGFAFGPIKRAIVGFGETVTRSTAGLISFIAIAAPWLPLIALAYWIGLRFFRRRNASPAAA